VITHNMNINDRRKAAMWAMLWAAYMGPMWLDTRAAHAHKPT